MDGCLLGGVQVEAKALEKEKDTKSKQRFKEVEKELKEVLDKYKPLEGQYKEVGWAGLERTVQRQARRHHACPCMHARTHHQAATRRPRPQLDAHASVGGVGAAQPGRVNASGPRTHTP